MKKVTIVVDDYNGGDVIHFHAETVEKALIAFIALYGGTKKTTLKSLLKEIQNEFCEMPFCWIIIADGKIIYEGMDPTNVYVERPEEEFESMKS